MSGKTDNNWIQRLAGEESTPALIDFLVNKLNGSSLNSLLLEVFYQRLKQETPADLLRRYKNNRLAQPSGADILRLKRLEMNFLEMAALNGMKPVELSQNTDGTSPNGSIGGCHQLDGPARCFHRATKGDASLCNSSTFAAHAA